eukprot:9497802-Pyramimonas_sp.AAC.1
MNDFGLWDEFKTYMNTHAKFTLIGSQPAHDNIMKRQCNAVLALEALHPSNAKKLIMPALKMTAPTNDEIPHLIKEPSDITKLQHGLMLAKHAKEEKKRKCLAAPKPKPQKRKAGAPVGDDCVVFADDERATVFDDIQWVASKAVERAEAIKVTTLDEAYLYGLESLEFIINEEVGIPGGGGKVTVFKDKHFKFRKGM